MEEQKYKNIYQFLETDTIPKGTSDLESKKLRRKAKRYFVQEGQLFRKQENGNPQRVILPDQTELIMFNMHKDQSGAHFGTKATYEKVKERYYWPKMHETIKQYIQVCDNCQRRGKPNRQEELISLKVGKPF